jgi:hexosaminidase
MSEMENCRTGEWQLILNPELSYLGTEGYRLTASTQGVQLSSATDAGLFYSIQTLRQLLPEQIELSAPIIGVSMPLAEIEDSPQFPWRGSMLDIARSFFGVEYIKTHIERMALFKLNRLHLHLSDDQGWRIELKSYPNLTTHGGQSAVIGGDSGYLTQSQYLDLQQYALARHIIIIPEIDMPGHIYSALASIPSLNCPDFSNLSPAKATPPDLYNGVEVNWDSLCLGTPDVNNFISTVITEISEMTLGPWIHIGGDEAKVATTYNTFISSVENQVYKLGKTPIGWQEILSATPRNETLAQIWLSNKIQGDNPKIISLCNWFYFDQSNTPDEHLPNDWCKKSGVSLEDVYSFSATGFTNVQGVEAPVWTEFAHTSGQIEDRLWPRLSATAEVAWSPESERDLNDFHLRLAQVGSRFDIMGIKFYQTPTVGWKRSPPSASPQSIFKDFTP